MKCNLESAVVITVQGSGHKFVRIYRGGRVFAAVCAEPFLSPESAWSDYRADPAAFRSYDETAGEFLK
jgi:hypothetical protein